MNEENFVNVDEGKDNIRIFAKSPFLYNNDIRYTLVNQKQDCTYEEISSLRAGSRLTDTDMMIMDALYKYRFLNRYCIEKYLNDGKSSVKKNLAKLVAHGIVLRFYFIWERDDANARTPSFYALSKGAYSFYKKKSPFKLIIDNTVKGFDIPNETSLLERLVFNQFHIHFMAKYRESILREAYYDKVSLKGYDFHIEGSFRLKVPDKSALIKWFDLVVIPVRRNPFWQREFITKLSLIYYYSQKHPTKLKSPIVLVICEDDVHAKEAFACKEADSQTRGIFTLFTCDIAMVTHDVLDWLYYCEYKSMEQVTEESGSRTTDNPPDDGSEIIAPIDINMLFQDGPEYDPLDNLSRISQDKKRIYLSVRSLCV